VGVPSNESIYLLQNTVVAQSSSSKNFLKIQFCNMLHHWEGGGHCQCNHLQKLLCGNKI